MKLLKLNQAIGVLALVAGFAWLFYEIRSPQGVATIEALYLMGFGLVWYAIARFLIWFRD